MATPSELWRPQPKQAAALGCPADELLFGGAAGGGKSDFLLADALRNAQLYGPAFRGVIFRMSFPELEELIDRSRSIYGSAGVYKTGPKTWRFHGGGTLKMRYIESDDDCYKYQGHAYSWIGWDEVGKYPTPFAYVYMLSRLRSAAGIPCLVRATANPGGSGNEWVKRYFKVKTHPNQIVVDSETKLSRCFIPSRLEDNMILDTNDPNYRLRLESLPDHLRRALLEGDWDVFAGQVFSEWGDQHVIRPQPLSAEAWKKFAAMDWGYAKPFALGWFAVNPDGRMIQYREFYGCKAGEKNKGLEMAATQVAQRAWELSTTEGVDTIVADPACWSKIDGTPSVAEQFEAVGFRMIKADNDRYNGLMRLHDLMQTKAHDGKPMLMVFSTCHATIEQIPTLVYDQKRVEDVDSAQEDHVYDMLRYAALSEFAVKPRLIRSRDLLAATRRDNEAARPQDVLRHGLRRS